MEATLVVNMKSRNQKYLHYAVVYADVLFFGSVAATTANFYENKQ